MEMNQLCHKANRLSSTQFFAAVMRPSRTLFSVDGRVARSTQCSLGVHMAGQSKT
jgi:hypothetical protein